MRTMQQIMHKDCVTVTTQDNIFEIALKMKQHDIGFIPVVEGRKLIGIVTDRDLVVRGYAEKHSGSTAVEQVMTKQIITATPQTTADEAAKLMASNKIRRLPILENGELQGVVAIGDLAVREQLQDEASDALSSISKSANTMSTMK